MTPVELSSSRRWTLFHFVVGAVACLAIPAQSWREGARSRAWNMYSKSSGYRLRIVAADGSGGTRWVAPSALAAHVEPDLAAALGGAESLRLGSEGIALVPHVLRLAELVCEVSHARRVTLVLDVRKAVGEPLQTTTVGRTCRPSGQGAAGP